MAKDHDPEGAGSHGKHDRDRHGHDPHDEHRGPGPDEHGVVHLTPAEYEKELARLQVELVKLQEWVIQEGLKVVVIFEGRDTAGKGGTIRRVLERLNARYARVVALGTPTERERSQWYFQRYIAHLPAAGEIVLFDRSWYNRAGVEHVMGFCTPREYDDFMRTCPQIERELVRSGIILIKYWLSISDEEQERRFTARIDNAGKRWKLSPMDLQARARWVDYAEAKDQMFAFTDIKEAPWHVVDAESKKTARLNLISHLLSQIPYEEVPHPKIELPPRQERAYMRPPIDSQSWIPTVYEVDRKHS
jgi:polyphosphate kinase 2